MIGNLIPKIIFIFLTFLKESKSNVRVTAPTELVNLFETGKFVLNQDIIPHKYGKFGRIPYSHEIYGRVFYKFDKDHDLGCDLSKMSPFFYFQEGNNSPIVMLDHGDCRYTKKALNAEFIGGVVVLIISDKDELTEGDPNNFDDGTGDKIKIPTVIIPKKHGDKIKEFMKNNPVNAQFVSLSIKFKMV